MIRTSALTPATQIAVRVLSERVGPAPGRTPATRARGWASSTLAEARLCGALSHPAAPERLRDVPRRRVNRHAGRAAHQHVAPEKIVALRKASRRGHAHDLPGRGDRHEHSGRLRVINADQRRRGDADDRRHEVTHLDRLADDVAAAVFGLPERVREDRHRRAEWPSILFGAEIAAARGRRVEEVEEGRADGDHRHLTDGAAAADGDDPLVEHGGRRK